MPKIEPRITLGNIAIFLQLLLMGWAASAAYTTLSNSVAEASADVADHEVRLRKLEAMTSESLARIDERLSNIEASVK